MTAEPANLVIDQYSPLSHKTAVGDGTTGTLNLAPTWVPETERRRLAAYLLLAAYTHNNARSFLRIATSLDLDEYTANLNDRDQHREYGDPDLLVDRIAAGILGDTWDIVVDGANTDWGDEPDLPPQPSTDNLEAGDPMLRVRQAQLDRWATVADAIVDTWIAGTAEQPFLQERQADLRTWADDVLLPAIVAEANRDAVELGDGVLVLWPRPGDWPEPRVYQPDGYFPVLTEYDDGGFPNKVHLAWEFETTVPGEGRKRWVRRLTWQMVSVASTHVTADGLSWAGEFGEPVDAPVLAADEELDEFGTIWRIHPWQRNPDGTPIVDQVPDPTDPTGQRTIEVPRRSNETCVFSDGTWAAGNLGNDIGALDDNAARWSEYRTDLRCDFLPVVHLPNTPNNKHHFGKSSIAQVAQVFDDLALADTDITSAARLAAVPVLALSGAAADDDTVVKPGVVFNLGADGRMDVLDLAVSLEKLMGHGDRLFDRLLVNARVPAALVGSTDAADAASGVSQLVSFGPFAQVVATGRMTRDPKLRLFLKMAQRLAQVQGALPPGPTPSARVAFGSFLPMDRSQLVTDVTAALKAQAISPETAVGMLMAGGFPIDDARAEVARIQRADTAGAKNIAEATASEELAAEYLGLELPAAPVVEPPRIDLP